MTRYLRLTAASGVMIVIPTIGHLSPLPLWEKVFRRERSEQGRKG